jgi:phosphatidate cytidylyltransferase
VRTASAAVLLPVALGCLWAGGLVWVVLTVVAGGLIGFEVARMARDWPMARRIAVALVWVAPGSAALVWLRILEPGGFGRMLFVFCLVWASDSGAYVVGRIVGGPKLAPAISPGKTRSGAVGGLLAAVAVGLAAAGIAGGGFVMAALNAALRARMEVAA